MTWSDSSWRFACGDVFPYCGLVYDTQPSCSPSCSTSFVVFCLLSTRLLHFNEKTRASWVVATRRTHGYTLARSCCVLMYIFFLIKALLHVYCISFYRSYSSYWQVFLGSSYALFVLWLCCSDLVCLRIGSRKQKKKKIKYLIPTCWSPIILRRSCNLGSELWIFHFLVLNRKKAISGLPWFAAGGPRPTGNCEWTVRKMCKREMFLQTVSLLSSPANQFAPNQSGLHFCWHFIVILRGNIVIEHLKEYVNLMWRQQRKLHVLIPLLNVLFPVRCCIQPFIEAQLDPLEP